jgi:hypothetical protein
LQMAMEYAARCSKCCSSTSVSAMAWMRVNGHGFMDLTTGAGCGLRVARCRLRAARCALQVARRVNAVCIIYLLQIYLSPALAVQTRCLRELRLLFG